MAEKYEHKTATRSFLGGSDDNSLVTEEGLSIRLVKGSIADQKVSAIVNSVGVDFDLSHGALSKIILEKAGPRIQQVLKSLRRRVVQHGTVTTTEGYDLPANFVFHGVLKEWDHGANDAEEILRTFIRNCLEEANERGMGSIAIPAIGTGNLGFPRDLVVNCLFEESDDFSESNPKTFINEIRFVVYEADEETFDAFVEKLNKILGDDEDEEKDEEEDDDEESESNSSSDDEDFEIDEDELCEFLEMMKEMGKLSENAFQKIGAKFPSTWESEPQGKPYRMTHLESTEDEFKMVSQRIMATKGSAHIKKILKIERIENPNLYQLYTVNKSHMEKKHGPRAENERTLWHGTVKESITNICSGGFNRSYCGKNAVVYGQGVYFARNFEYSAQSQYSRPDKDGTKYIFMCKVLTGRFNVGNDKMVEPEMIPKTDHRFDSTVNDLVDPGIFVIFKDAHAYPEYLVSFN